MPLPPGLKRCLVLEAAPEGTIKASCCRNLVSLLGFLSLPAPASPLPAYGGLIQAVDVSGGYMSKEKMREGEDASKEEFKVFVGGLSWQLKDSDLKEAFSKFDPVDASIMIDKHTLRPRGFGFVTFKDKLGMEDAIRDMHEKELEGRKISVVRAVPQDQTKPGTPAAALGGGGYGGRRDARYGGRDYRPYDRGGYDRGYPDRYGGGYDRGGYDRAGGYYDPRYAQYDRGYDGRGYAGYGGYDRGAPHYRDPYGRDPYAGYAGYGHYDRGYDGYDSRGTGGPDRRPYPAARGTPYDRPADRRPADSRAR